MKKTILLFLVLWLLFLPAVSFAGDHAVASETIWPTQNDVAAVAGDGKKFLENQWNKPLVAIHPNNYFLSGLTVPGTSGTLSINVANGVAYIAGRHITIPGSTAVLATANNTNYVFLKLTRDGGNLVTGAAFEVNTTDISPADSTPIATLTAGTTTITATADRRRFAAGTETIGGGTTWTVPAGIRRIFVEVVGASGGGGGGGGSGVGATAGGAGTGGGTTTFGSMSVTGGAAGYGGAIGTTTGSLGAAHGIGSGGQVNRIGGGNPGGSGGGGGGTQSHNGGDGGAGGYSNSWLEVTPDTDINLSIGSAGGAGSAGAGASGAGAAGRAGTNGVIFVHW